MECIAFHFVEKHIMAIFQDDNVKITQTQNVKEWLWGSMKNHFHTWIGTSEGLWDVLEETSLSAGLLHWQYKILPKNVCK